MGEHAEIRRRAATRAMIRYFLLGFMAALILGGLVTYAVYESRARRAESRALRIEYCLELEKLKAQNREDLAKAKKDYRRNLRLLGIKDTPELRRAAQEGWDRREKRNRPRPCPYTA